MTRLGTGIGWRPEIAAGIDGLPGIDWVEVVAENLGHDRLPEPLTRLRQRGVTVVPHGVALGLGGAERPAPGRLAGLARCAELTGAPLVTEHIAFVRAGGLEAGHLLPVPRTRDCLDVLCANVRIAQDALPVPLALENIAALFSWPDEEFTEGEFLSELVERTGVRLLIDVANLHTNHVNRGEDPAKELDRLPLDAIAYVHVAGGYERDGVWHDTHAHPVTEPVLDVLRELCARTTPPGVLLERDENFPPVAELATELATITAALCQQGGDTAALRQYRHLAGVGEGAGAGAGQWEGGGEAEEALAAARGRLAVRQDTLLAALVDGAAVPDGFDRERLGVQASALTAKRADVIAKIAPDLPHILGAEFRDAFLAYAAEHPLTGGYRQDALAFARQLLDAGRPARLGTRRALRRWYRARTAITRGQFL